jgi:hypothetical protein
VRVCVCVGVLCECVWMRVRAPRVQWRSGRAGALQGGPGPQRLSMVDGCSQGWDGALRCSSTCACERLADDGFRSAEANEACADVPRLVNEQATLNGLPRSVMPCRSLAGHTYPTQLWTSSALLLQVTTLEPQCTLQAAF